MRLDNFLNMIRETKHKPFPLHLDETLFSDAPIVDILSAIGPSTGLQGPFKKRNTDLPWVEH